MEAPNKKTSLTDEQKKERQREYWRKWYNEKGKKDKKYLEKKKALSTRTRNLEITKLRNELKMYQDQFGELQTESIF